MSSTIKNQEFVDNSERTPIRLRDKIVITISLFLGVFGTIGGWSFLLALFGFAPVFPEGFTILNLILAISVLTTLYTALLAGGPILIHSAIMEYRELKEDK